MPLPVGKPATSPLRGFLHQAFTELERIGWPLSDLEVAAIDPIYRAFRVDMVAWALHDGLEDGSFDSAMIERQLQRTAGDAPH